MGKTGWLDTMLNQVAEQMGDKTKSLTCVRRRQKRSTVAQLGSLERDALQYCVIVAAAAADAPLQFLAPYAGCTIGEYFRDNGAHALTSTMTCPSRQ